MVAAEPTAAVISHAGLTVVAARFAKAADGSGVVTGALTGASRPPGLLIDAFAANRERAGVDAGDDASFSADGGVDATESTLTGDVLAEGGPEPEADAPGTIERWRRTGVVAVRALSTQSFVGEL